MMTIYGNTRPIQWKPGVESSKEIASVLCEREPFFVTPDDKARAEEVLAGEIFYRQRLIKISDWRNPKNIEDSLRSSWKFHYHSLSWLAPLRRQFLISGKPSYKALYLSELKTWIDEFGQPANPLPTQKAPGDYSWYDMSCAWRTMVIIGAISLVGADKYFLDSLAIHADVLAKDVYYAQIGNHALHQNHALMSAAMVLDHGDYFHLALDRIAALRDISIDGEGVALEGAAGYQLFNVNWWHTMKHQLEVAGHLVADIREILIPDMRPFLRCVIAPDGKVVPLGDSTLTKGIYRNVVNEYPSDFVEYIESDHHLLYALSQGRSGSPLKETMHVFSDGYWFSVGNHADRRPELQSHASLRFGPGLSSRVHAHDDAGSVTFYPRGVRVLEDGGIFGYYGGERREFAKSVRAHNSIIVEGRKYYRSAISIVNQTSSNDSFDQAEVSVKALESTKWDRIVAHSCAEDLLFIQDHLLTKNLKYSQIFNLGDGFEIVEMRGNRVDACKGDDVKVSLIWLNEEVDLGLARGKTNPLLGWRSTFEGELHPVPCIMAENTVSEPGKIEKSALIVLLLAQGENFSDIKIQGIKFRTKVTKFTLLRRSGAINVQIEFGGSDAQSTLSYAKKVV